MDSIASPRNFREELLLAGLFIAILSSEVRAAGDPLISIKAESASYTYLQTIRGGQTQEVTDYMPQSGGRWTTSQPIGENGVNGAVASSFEAKASDYPGEGSIVALLHHVIDRTGGTGEIETNGSAVLALQIENADEDTKPVVVTICRTIVPVEGASGTVEFGEQVIEIGGSAWTHREVFVYDAEDDIPEISIDGKLTMTGTGKIEVFTTITATISGCNPNPSPEEAAACETDDPDDDEADPEPDCPEGNSNDVGDAMHIRLTTGNIWTRVPVFKSQVAGETEFDLELGYDLLRSYDPGFAYGWFHSYYFRFYHYFNSNQGRYKSVFISQDGRRNAFSGVSFLDGHPWDPPIGRDLNLYWDMQSNPLIVSADGTEYHFEPTSYTGFYRVQKIVDLHKRETLFSYDQSGYKVTTITSPYGRTIQFGYNSTTGRLETITDPNGKVTHLTINSANDLKEIEDPLTHTIAYDYDSNHNMTQEKFEGEVDKTYNAYRWSTGGHQYSAIKVVKPGQSSTEETIAQVVSGSFPSTNYYAIGADGVSYTDGRGNPHTYYRDNLGRLTQKVTELEGVGTSVETVYFGVGAAAGHNRNRLRLKYDANSHVTSFTWTEFGRIETREDDQGNVETFEYEHPKNKTLVTRHILPPKPDQSADQWVFEYWASTGDLKKVVDPIVESGTDLTIDYSYQYYSTGNPGRLQKKTLTDRNGHQTWCEYTYSSSGYEETITRDPGSGHLNLVTVNAFDKLGRLLTETVHRGDANIVTKHTYDDMSRVLDTIEDYAEGSGHLNLTTARHYDDHGNLDYIINPREKTTTYEYDHRNRLKKEVVDDVNGGLQLKTEYTLDGNGNVEQVKDPKDRITVFICDELDHLVQSTDAEDYVTKLTRDLVGNLRQIDRAVDKTSSPEFRSVAYDFDSLNRITSKTIDPDATSPLVTSYEYDGATACACNPATPGVSLPHKITDPNSKITYLKYDELNRLRFIVRKVGSVSTNDAITEYQYDPMGNIRHILGPVNEDTEFTYDPADRRVSKIIHDSINDTVTTYFDHDGADNVDQVTLPNGNGIYLTYDKANRITLAEDTVGAMFGYEYDKNGNVLKRYDGLNAANHSYYWE
jgi:YD repeat-containing protein